MTSSGRANGTNDDGDDKDEDIFVAGKNQSEIKFS